MNLTFKLTFTGYPMEYPFTAPTVNAAKKEALEFMRKHNFTKAILFQYFTAYSEYKPVLTFEPDDIIPMPDKSNELDWY